MNYRFLKLGLTASALPLLSGCVAALVPLAAGGAMFSGGKEQPVVNEVAAEMAAPAPAIPAPPPAPRIAIAQPTELAPVKPATVAIVSSEGSIPQAASDAVYGPAESDRELVAAATSPVLPIPPGPTLVRSVPARSNPASPIPANSAPAIEPAVAPPATLFAKIPPTQSKPLVELPAARPAPTIPRIDPNPALSVLPIQAAIDPAAPVGPTDYRAYDVLYNYVDLQSRREPIDSPRQSAILAAPGSLSPIRTDCSIRPPAVLIDLDPASQVFDPTIIPRANPALTQMLASLRLQEVEIFWVSELTAVKAGDVRKALIASGMDPRGRDGLLLMRRVGDRKQERRKELNETHCVLAIAGDRRSDFDELYDYLRDKSAAQSLEELIGAGWFLTPNPLTGE